MNRIPVAEPVLNGNEKKYVNDCIDTGWISGSGKYVTGLEEQFAAYCNARYGIAVFNGTVALHVALLALKVGAGDEVIVPDLTYIASTNTVVYCGATPVLVDVDPYTWTLDIEDVKRKITPRTKAIMPVHIYGHPAEMGPLVALAKEHGIAIIEDAAEAHGAEYKGQRVGGIGEVSAFSLFGNKIITSGEGGIITTNDEAIMQEIRLLKGQGVDPKRRYWHPVIGYNYRMTNVQAAIALAQLERIDWFVGRRLEVAQWYSEELKGSPFTLSPQAEWAKTVYWLFSVLVPEGIDRDRVMVDMDAQGIETRPFFYPVHVLPPYHDPEGDAKFPVSTAIAARGINLPSSAKITRADVKRIAESMFKSLEMQQGK